MILAHPNNPATATHRAAEIACTPNAAPSLTLA